MFISYATKLTINKMKILQNLFNTSEKLQTINNVYQAIALASKSQAANKNTS